MQTKALGALSENVERRFTGIKGHVHEKRHVRCITNSSSGDVIGGKTAQCTSHRESSLF